METTKTNFKDYLKQNGILTYTNKGVSMRPLIKEGRDVMVIESKTKPLKKYDVALFINDDGRYILHRVMKIKNDSYFIIGDNCITGDNVREEQVIGILTAVKRNGKTIKVTDTSYKIYSHFWWYIFPLRFLFKKLVALKYKCIGQIFDVYTKIKKRQK